MRHVVAEGSTETFGSDSCSFDATGNLVEFFGAFPSFRHATDLVEQLRPARGTLGERADEGT